MQLEGKILGYNKRTVAMIVLLVILAGVMFYAGAKYEKKKLGSMGLLRDVPQTKKGGTKSKTATPAPAPTDNSGAPSDTTAPASPNSVAPGTPTTPSTTPTPSSNSGNDLN